MIAFRKDEDSEEDKIMQGLQKLFEEISNLDTSDIIGFKPEEYDNVNISDITQVIYDTLYQKNNTAISLLITKNDNNSLNLVIDTIE
jgi:uncharacterized protein YfkK (UPF0435 family)